MRFCIFILTSFLILNCSRENSEKHKINLASESLLPGPADNYRNTHSCKIEYLSDSAAASIILQKTEILYLKNGQVYEQFVFDTSGNFEAHYIFEKDTVNNTLIRISYNQDERILERKICQLDDAENIIEEKYYHGNSNYVFDNWFYDYNFNEKRIDFNKALTYYSAGPFVKGTHIFDENFNLIETQIKLVNNRLLERYFYTYNPDNLLLSYTQYQKDQLVSQTRYTYDEQSRVIRILRESGLSDDTPRYNSYTLFTYQGNTQENSKN